MDNIEKDRQRNNQYPVSSQSVPAQSQWAGIMLLMVFFLAALIFSPKSHASVSSVSSVKSVNQNIAISLRISGLYGEIFEMAMEAYREKNFAAAIKLWEPIAQSGYAAAQYNLGVAHAKGLAVNKDMNQAGQWWQAAAEQGNVDAQYNLGLLYATGNGVEMSMKKAVHWWQMAAAVGDPAAQFNLGMMYARGDGVAKNMDAAMHWWTRSAAQEFQQAQELLSQMAAE